MFWSNSRSTSSAFFPDTIIPSSLQAILRSFTFSSSNRIDETPCLLGCSTCRTWGIEDCLREMSVGLVTDMRPLAAAMASAFCSFDKLLIMSGSFCIRTPFGYCCCRTCSCRNSCCCCNKDEYGESDFEGGLGFVLPPFGVDLLGGTYSW